MSNAQQVISKLGEMYFFATRNEFFFSTKRYNSAFLMKGLVRPTMRIPAAVMGPWDLPNNFVFVIRPVGKHQGSSRRGEVQAIFG